MEEVSNPFFIQQKKEREKVWNSKVRRQASRHETKKIDKRKRKEECKTLKNGKGCVSAAAPVMWFQNIYTEHVLFFPWNQFHENFRENDFTENPSHSS